MPNVTYKSEIRRSTQHIHDIADRHLEIPHVDHAGETGSFLAAASRMCANCDEMSLPRWCRSSQFADLRRSADLFLTANTQPNTAATNTMINIIHHIYAPGCNPSMAPTAHAVCQYAANANTCSNRMVVARWFNTSRIDGMTTQIQLNWLPLSISWRLQ